MKIAIVPGSFDPMTIGHVDIVERAANMFDQVVVAVMINRDKTYRFSMDQRREMAVRSCAHIPNVKVISDEGMLADLAARLGACAIVKGIRDEKDLVYEQKMAQYNKARNPATETVFLTCDPRYSSVSSTAVREALTEGRPIDALVSPAILTKLVEK